MPPTLTAITSRDSRDEGNCSAGPNQLVISRPTFIVALTICIALTCIFLLGLIALGYREWERHRENKSARVYGRNSVYLNRISMMRKEVDDSFSRQYSGCLSHEPENPYLVPKTPVEILTEETVCEAPEDKADKRKSKASLFFDNNRGLWFPRH